MYDLMILGGGPAGLAASVYAARKRLNALLISVDIGGQMNKTMGIENYLGYQFVEAPELIDKFQTQMNHYPMDQKISEKVARLEKIDNGFEAITESGDRYQAKAAIIATGKSPRKLNIPGEEELTGLGVTYCAICDGPIFSGQKVAVVGGGNSALEAALDMVKIAEYVNLISLTPLTGDAVLVDKLSEANNLSIFTEYQTEKIDGQGITEGITIKDIKSGQSQRLEVGGIFIEIGLIPNSDAVSNLVKLNKLGEVPINSSCETELPGLYAAGDVSTVPEKQIIVAAGEGAKATLQAHRYLQRLTE
ncbi:FAD-dependent oxidoreductase [Chloroflexota bacterium]